MLFVRDEWVDPVTAAMMPGSEFHQIWAGDEPPSFPDDGSLPAVTTYFPGIGGFRFGQFAVPPESARTIDANLQYNAATGYNQMQAPQGTTLKLGLASGKVVAITLVAP